jgi:hypothetical protein
MSNGDNRNAVLRPLGASLGVVGVLVVLFSAGAALEAMRLSSLGHYEVWGHLRAGSWILTNKSWPATGLFSQAANFPWQDCNWAPDAVIGLAYRVLGLSAVVGLWMVYRLVLAAVTFLLAGGSRENFWFPAGLSVVAQYLLFGLGPVGAGNSAIFFAVELFVLVQSRITGQFRRLFWLPLLFVLWANCDLGFVYGVALLVLFVAAASTVEKIVRKGEPAYEINLGTVAGVSGACLLATLLTPYGYHAYSTFLAIQTSPANRYIFEYTAMTFHLPQDYVLLLLTMTAFLAMGLRRSRDLFLLSALVLCAALSFYAQGGNWLVVLAAVGAIGNQFSREGAVQAEKQAEPRNWFLLPAAVSLGVVVLLYGLLVPRDPSVLMDRIARNLPVRACDFIRQHQLPAPLFNTQTWGSFLTWYLPEYPVAIDGRRGLYPDYWETDYFRVMKVLAPYQSFSPLLQARTLLLYNHSMMGDALRSAPGFQVAYQDDMALVLVHQPIDTTAETGLIGAGSATGPR